MLHEAGVRLLADARVLAVEPGHVAVQLGEAVEKLDAAAVIHAGRHRPVDGLVSALRDRGIDAVAIGDARVPRLVEDAVRSGWEAARAL
jgi:hypothetical protein